MTEKTFRISGRVIARKTRRGDAGLRGGSRHGIRMCSVTAWLRSSSRMRRAPF